MHFSFQFSFPKPDNMKETACVGFKIDSAAKQLLNHPLSLLPSVEHPTVMQSRVPTVTAHRQGVVEMDASGMGAREPADRRQGANIGRSVAEKERGGGQCVKLKVERKAQTAVHKDACVVGKTRAEKSKKSLLVQGCNQQQFWISPQAGKLCETSINILEKQIPVLLVFHTPLFTYALI